MRCATRFSDRHVPGGATGQVRSVAGRGALIAVAGELARDYGVLPWPEGEALRAAGACFLAWLAQRGGAGPPAEDAAALAQVRGFLEAHGKFRFTTLTTPVSGLEPALPDVTRPINRVGFRRRVSGDSDERWEYSDSTRGVEERGVQGTGRQEDGRFASGARVDFGQHGTPPCCPGDEIPGEGKRRVYRVSGAIWRRR